MKISMKNGNVTINGVLYPGHSISIDGDSVIVDGVRQGSTLVGPISIYVNGDCESIDCKSGTVSVLGSVSGDVHTGSGDISCMDVGGNVSTVSGDVQCGNVAGSVRSGSGDILHR